MFSNDLATLGITEQEFCKALALILCRCVRVFEGNELKKVNWGFDFEYALQDVSELERKIHKRTGKWDELKIGFFIAHRQRTITDFCIRYDVDVNADEDSQDVSSFEYIIRRMYKVALAHPKE